MPNCHRRDIFLEIFINFSMIKAPLSIHVLVTCLAWFTVKSLLWLPCLLINLSRSLMDSGRLVHNILLLPIVNLKTHFKLNRETEQEDS